MPSTTYAIPAASLPALQGPGVARLIGDASTDPAVAICPAIISGETTTFARKNAKQALEIDYGLRCGAQGYGVIEGFGFSGAALSLTVAAGKATIGGIVELSVATVVVLADNATNTIWLKSNGTLEARSDTSAPATPGLPIGVVITSAGAVVNYDLSPVMYHANGLLRRKTGDAYKPADTPGVTWCFISEGTNATYLWDGAAYRYLAPADGHAIDQSAYAAITGTVALAATDPNVQVFKNTSGGDQKVKLPRYAAWGSWFRIRNHKGSAHSLLIRDWNDTATIATLTAGQIQEFYPDDDSAGTPLWPVA